MTRLPDLTGKQLIRALERAGWTIKSQKGSHVKLVKEGIHHFLIVPDHGGSTIPKGTLAIIIKDAGLTNDELRELL